MLIGSLEIRKGEIMNLKTACYIAIFLSIGSMFFVFPGNLLFYFPIFQNAPDAAIHLLLTRFVPYFIVSFISIISYVILLISMVLRVKDPRSGTFGLGASSVLTVLTALALFWISIQYVIEGWGSMAPAQLIVYAASGIICFISGLVLLLFILMFLLNTAGAMWPALVRIVFTLLYSLVVISSLVLFVRASPKDYLYLIAYAITYFGIFMAIAADLLVMTAYIGHAKKTRAVSSAVPETRYQPV